MQSSSEAVRAFDQFRDSIEGWEKMTPYAIARTFWDAGLEFAEDRK